MKVILQLLIPAFLIYISIATLVYLVDVVEKWITGVDNYHTSKFTRVMIYLFYIWLLLHLK